MEDKIDKLLKEAKAKLAKDNPEAEPVASTRHVSRIRELLEEHKGKDVIMHTDFSTHDHFVISREEEYACVTGSEVSYHYLFSNKFKDYQLIPQ
jgi:hypothetical protein